MRKSISVRVWTAKASLSFGSTRWEMAFLISLPEHRQGRVMRTTRQANWRGQERICCSLEPDTHTKVTIFFAREKTPTRGQSQPLAQRNTQQEMHGNDHSSAQTTPQMQEIGLLQLGGILHNTQGAVTMVWGRFFPKQTAQTRVQRRKTELWRTPGCDSRSGTPQ